MDHVTSWFTQRGWPLRIVRCKEADANKSAKERIFPVFAVVATKFKKMANMPSVLEMSLSADGQTSRLKTPADLVNSVRGIQQFAAVRAGAAKGGQGKFFDSDARHEDVSLDLRSSDSEDPRYSLFVTERERPGGMKFAVFIVPQGRSVFLYHAPLAEPKPASLWPMFTKLHWA